MFKFIESVITKPIRLVAAPQAILWPGLVGQIREINGTVVCDVSDGSRPFGVIDSFKNIKYNDLRYSIIVKVWPQRMIFRTGHYDYFAKYKPGDALYVNVDGILTTTKIHENSQIVARLITPPTDDDRYFEALWL